jgi:hypothetical protein
MHKEHERQKGWMLLEEKGTDGKRKEEMAARINLEVIL